LALSAQKLAQAADRLAEATLQKSHERQDQALKTPSESIADVTASGEHAQGANAADLTASEEYPDTLPDDTEDR
jgi:hypothetical protein